MKWGMLAGTMLLTACDGTSSQAPGNGLVAAEAEGRAAAEDDGRIQCAPPGEAEFRRVCTVDRLADAGGTLLTVHLPDGGFHRLRIAEDGRGVVAADGSEQAVVRVVGDREIEVAIGGARYRLPATVKADDPA
ncbi:hypothetical protein [Sphingomonas sp. Y38-1Y]|uniref:hypothetical protein n=1 Tax=Sphingomonas sp. Y38-1Y TaxID=3078265 RepID=UPI0028E404D1|nr:hypothetical protein [Sphingomonas sp. Y38-1Y]